MPRKLYDIVLRDATDSPYNVIDERGESPLRFTGGTDFSTITDLATMPVDASIYLMKIAKAVRKNTCHLPRWCKGWKMKKGNPDVENNAVTNLPPAQNWLHHDDAELMRTMANAMLNTYVLNTGLPEAGGDREIRIRPLRIASMHHATVM